jgi:broad specificity phosphatase PhoE
MTTFLLVRHATCKQMYERLNGRTEDAPLEPAGWVEARELARRLAELPVSDILASPRERAQQTAEVIAAPHGVRPQTSVELDEVDFGSWSGETFAALESDPRWHDWNRDREHTRAPGGESMQDVQHRTLKLLRTLEEHSGDACIVLVSHAEVIRSVLLYMEHRSLDRYGEIPLPPASVATVRLAEPAP